MYCPRRGNDSRTRKDIYGYQEQPANTSFATEYSLNSQAMGPLGASPPNLWTMRLKARLNTY